MPHVHHSHAHDSHAHNADPGHHHHHSEDSESHHHGPFSFVHHHHDHPRIGEVRRKGVRRVLVITLVLNVAVVLLKGWVGIATGSLSLMADALHSVTDSINNVLGLVTNQLAAPEPDREHPYGHQKFEAVGALGIAAFLGIACFEILQSAIERIMHGGKALTINGPELWFLIIVLGINIFVAFYERAVGKRLDSPILLADAQHTMSDVWITITVLAGLIGTWTFKTQWLDIALAFPVAALVLWSAWEVLKSNLPWLVDEMAIAPEAIQQTVMEVPGVINCHNIASRGMLGRHVFAEMHLIVSAKDVETAHEITEAVEALLRDRYGPIRPTIHVEPPSYVSEELTYTPDSQHV